MTVNTQELRELAEKATPGPWKSVDREVLEDNSVYPVHIVGGSADYQVCLMESPNLAKLAMESAAGSWPYNRRAIDANSAYIAAANPSTVSALLAENDALRAELQAHRSFLSALKAELGLVLTDDDTELSPGALRTLLWADREMTNALALPPAPPQGDGA